MIERPERGECLDYYFIYIDRAPPGDVLAALADECDRTVALLRSIPPERETFRYAPGKWTVREVVGHVIDVERAFSNRAFAIARRDPQPIPGFEQDQYNEASNARDRSLRDLASEFEAVRASSLSLFRGLADDVWTASGIASGNSFTVRCFPFMLVGHELHHRSILETRYLSESA